MSNNKYDWEELQEDNFGYKPSLNLSKVKSSRNLSEGEVERRLKGKDWSKDAGLCGIWSNCKEKGPC